MSIHVRSVGVGLGIVAVIIGVLYFGTNFFMQPSDIRDGELIQGENRVQVYLIQDGKKRHIMEPEVFDALGYTSDMIRNVPSWIVDSIPTGMPIRATADL